MSAIHLLIFWTPFFYGEHHLLLIEWLRCPEIINVLTMSSLTNRQFGLLAVTTLASLLIVSHGRIVWKTEGWLTNLEMSGKINSVSVKLCTVLYHDWPLDGFYAILWRALGENSAWPEGLSTHVLRFPSIPLHRVNSSRKHSNSYCLICHNTNTHFAVQ